VTRSTPKRYWLIKSPIVVSCINNDLEEQIVLRVSLLTLVR
jgi:hypothetical protein